MFCRNGYKNEKVKADIRTAIAETQTIIELPEIYDDLEKNTSVCKTVDLLCDFINIQPDKPYAQPTKLTILRFPSEIAALTELDTDTVSLEAAFNAFSILELTAMGITGKTLSIHHQSAQAFSKIMKRLESEPQLSDAESKMLSDCYAYIDLIRRAQAQIIARSMILPMKWIRNDHYITGASGPTKGERTRPNHKTTSAADQIFKTLEV